MWAAAGGYQERLALGRTAAKPSAVEELERRMAAAATKGSGAAAATKGSGAAAASHAPAAAAPTGGAGKKAIKRPAAAAPAGAVGAKAVKRPAGAEAGAVAEIVNEVVKNIDVMVKPNGEPTTRKFCTDKAYGQAEAKAKKKDTRPSLLFSWAGHGTSAKFAPRVPRRGGTDLYRCDSHPQR